MKSVNQPIKYQEYFLLLVVILLTATLVLLSKAAYQIVILPAHSALVNKQIIYQSMTLLIAVIFLFMLRFLKKEDFDSFFRVGDLRGKIVPVKAIGINPKEHENWLHLGINFAIVITTVTAIIIYFQLIQDSSISGEKILHILPFALLFALSNSFVEESITRLGVVVLLTKKLANNQIPYVSAILFGTVHYWGNPGGVPGVLAAGFLGWFLAKSIIETKGLFWAWFIHFLQDVVIFTALLSIS